MARAATYVRVSTQDQAEERASVPAQEADIAAVCERLGHIVVASFQDTERYRATRGKDKNKIVEPGSERWDRPGYVALCEAISAGQVDVVVSQCWDRLAAGGAVEVLLAAIEEAPQSVEILTAWEGTVQKVFLRMLSAMRAEENQRRRQRVIMAGKARLKEGKSYGGYFRFGHDYNPESGTWSLNEYEAGYVRQIFQWYVDGVVVREIGRRLVTAGVPQKQGFAKRPWAPKVIRMMLKNPAYTGRLIVKWDGKPYEVAVPAIVSQADFDKAQGRMARNNTWRDRNKRLPYLLSGLLRCGHCGTLMRSCGRRYRYKNGERTLRPKPIRYHQCVIGGDGYQDECPNRKAINAELLETAVWDAISEYLKDPNRLIAEATQKIEKYRAERAHAQESVDRLQSRVGQLEEERQWLILQARKGTISQEDFEAQIAMLDIERSDADRSYQEALTTMPDNEALANLQELIETCRRGLLHELTTLDKLEPSEVLTSAPVERRGRVTALERKRQILLMLVDEVVVDHEQGALRLHGTLERVIQFREPQARLASWLSA